MSDSSDAPVKVVDRRWWARGEATTPDETASRKPTYIEDLEQQLAGTTAQLQATLSEYRQAQQEFDQVRVRLRREVARDVERGRRVVLAELLEVLDNLDRAVSAAREADERASGEAFVNLARGVALVRDQFMAKLGQFGVARLEALGRPFDAALHEAVSTVEVTDSDQEGVIVAVVREGYAVGDELLRAASVVVGRAR